MDSSVPPPSTSRVVTTPDEASTRALAARLGRALRALHGEGLLIVLHGDLGAGKTVFVKGLAEGLAISRETPVVSPTFTIARSYPVPGTELVLHHLDAYRLEGAEDLEAVGFEEMCGEGCVTCVEWGSRVSEALPEERLDLWIDMLAAVEPCRPGEAPRAPRRLRFQARGPVAHRILSAVDDTANEAP